MSLPLLTRVVVVLGVVVGLLAYAVVVDLGVSAGRIHHGVSLNGEVDLGGLSAAEAFDLLHDLKDDLIGEPIVFSTEGLTLITCARGCPPNGLGFRFDVPGTVKAAMDVGRSGGPLVALGRRAGAWLWGERITWAGRPRYARVTRLIDDWERRAAALGLRVDRGRLRFMLRTAARRLPYERVYELPLIGS
jgi:hypothetical protein